MKKIINLFIALLLVLVFSAVFSVSVSADDYVVDSKGYKIYYPKTNGNTPIRIPEYSATETEFRGVWVSFFAGDISGYSTDEQMRNQLLEVLNVMDEFNLNAIMFHMRTHNDALYPTDLAPQSGYVRGMNYDKWNYIDWFIEECHKRGIEFHAWLNPYRISSGSTNEGNIKSKYAAFPKNPASNMDNVLINSKGEAILDPGRPVVQDYIVDVCMEIIERYDVDAIHFDDYFYIDSVDDSETRKLYNTKKLSTDDFRRESVDSFIKKLSDEMYDYNIKNSKAIQLGISPSGIYRNGNSYVAPSGYKYDANGNLTSPIGSASAGYAHYGNPLYCDTLKWVNNEWIDYIVPQVYNSMDTDAACYAAVVEWWNAAVKNKKVNLYIGVGLYKKGSSVDSGGTWATLEDEWSNQLRFNQKNSYVKGTCIYQWKSLKRFYSSAGVQKVLNEHFTNKTQLPVARRYEGLFDSVKNSSVKNIKINRSNDNVLLTWDKLENTKDYVVYQYSGTLDINDAKQVVGITGNSSLDKVKINIKYNSKLGKNFAIMPLTLANEMCKVESINIDLATKFDNSIPVVSFNAPYLTGVKQREGKLNFRFYDSIIEIGNSVSYKVYYCNGTEWVESERKELGDITKTGGINTVFFQMDKYGSPLVIRIEASTEFGSCYSDDYLVKVDYTSSNDMFKEVYYYFNSFIKDLYN